MLDRAKNNVYKVKDHCQDHLQALRAKDLDLTEGSNVFAFVGPKPDCPNFIGSCKP